MMKLLLAAQSGREIDATVFAHENAAMPPSLTRNGKMFYGTKSDVIPCLTSLSTVSMQAPANATAVIMDGAQLVQSIRPSRGDLTIGDYLHNTFLTHLVNLLQKVQRLDVVFDQYFDKSLKTAVRENRGTGDRLKVTHSTKIPSNWSGFLRCNQNKTELFRFLGDGISKLNLQTGKYALTSSGSSVLCTKDDYDTHTIEPCNHEEADTRLMLHVVDACINDSHKSIILKTNDSDVIILAVSTLAKLPTGVQLWLGFGSGKNFHYIPAHEIFESLGTMKSSALPGFHAFTGSDTTAAFFGKGKKKAWETWQGFSEATAAFRALSRPNPTMDTVRNVFPILEEFVVRMYGITSHNSVDEARADMFFQKSLGFEKLPPSSDALYQKSLRSAYTVNNIHFFLLVNY